MRAVHITSLDGPDSVQIVDVDEPAARENAVVIDVHAAGVAFPDALLT
ncbi:MAG: NADPH:quinone oxidoreductase family protein, partial [Rhodococcus sp. (in: high G+C Gram-positive bacteria)]